ncbi:MAG: ester cyclase, partial [Pseudomonadota bacterium]
IIRRKSANSIRARGCFKPHIKAEYIAAILNLVSLNKKSLAIGAGPYIVKWTLTGTHLGTYFGIKPTGKKFKMTGVDIETIIDGKIVEHDGAEDMLGLLQQIGAAPVKFE